MHEGQRAALERFIAQAAGARAAAITQAQLLSGGAIQENWRLDIHIDGGAHDGPLAAVLRCDSASAGVATSHGRAQEFALLKAAHVAGVTVPEPLWLCQDRAVFGRPFFVMRRVEGTAAAHRIVKDPALGGDRVRLAEQLGRELARIHSIRPPRPDLAFLPVPELPPAAWLIDRARRWLDGHELPHPVMEWGLRWLERHAPAPGELNLCHRDYRSGNYMVDGQGLTGILDWEFAGWSDPLEDIGWFCAKCWRFGRNEREAGGIGAREDFYRGYEAESGRAIAREQVRYWEVMAHMNWALISIQQAQRHVSGEESSLLLALTAHITPELEWEILSMTEED
ncbi:phosphotransferase family protein [Azohydromonas sp. G-1-1-14]|uniref:Phosphotransferase family protein n=1 Tax=Azohydromonas caseinilytica TaxID=2728836 RepID=A0A848F8B9_9BURK|nr:phosphotransferase family protein [Azohydromonas caseinilytica]